MRVACSARSADVLDELHHLNPGVLPLALDVTDAGAMVRAVGEIEDAQGPLDLAVFNAGVYEPVPGGLENPELFTGRSSDSMIADSEVPQ